MTDLVVFHGGVVDSDEADPPPPRRPGRRRGVVAAVFIVALLGAVVTFGFAAPGLLGPWTSSSNGDVPISITTPWTWQGNAQSSPPGPATLIFTGDGPGLFDDDVARGRIAIVGRNGSYRSVYPDRGRWTAGGNAHLSPDGRYVASLHLRGSDTEVTITDLTTGEIRDLPSWQNSEVLAVYGWRSDGGAVAIGFRAGSALGVGVLDLRTGQTTPIGPVASVPELAGDVSAAFTPDGRGIAVAVGAGLALFGTAPVDIGNQEPLWTAGLDPGVQFSGVFTPDGRRVVLFTMPACATVLCAAAIPWGVSYLDSATGKVTDGPAVRPFSAAAVRAVGWNETTGGLVVVGLTAQRPFGPTDRDARQLVQPGSADLYELGASAEPRLLVDAPDEVTGLDVASDLVRAGRFGDRPSVPSLWPFERAPVDPVGAAVVGGILVAVGAVVFVRWWQGRRRGRHRASPGFRPRPR